VPLAPVPVPVQNPAGPHFTLDPAGVPETADQAIPTDVVESVPGATAPIGSGQVGIASTTKLSKKTSGPKPELATKRKIACEPIQEVGRYTVVSTKVPGVVVPAPVELNDGPDSLTRVSHDVAVRDFPSRYRRSLG